MTPSSDIAFTPSVKAIQTARGSRDAYARVEERGGWRVEIDDGLASYLAEARSAFLATATAEGQPYAQHRGGPAGFIKVLDAHTIGFADFSGNRQYITTGNLSENPRAYIIVMDYANRRRVKLWGTAEVVAAEGELAEKLALPGYKARVEQAILFHVEAWDTNCPQHIPQLFPAEVLAEPLARAEARIAELEAELARLRNAHRFER